MTTPPNPKEPQVCLPPPATRESHPRRVSEIIMAITRKRQERTRRNGRGDLSCEGFILEGVGDGEEVLDADVNCPRSSSYRISRLRRCES